MPLQSAVYRIAEAALAPDGAYVMPHGVRCETWQHLNARWYRNHAKLAGTVGSSLHPQKRTLWVWLSANLTELFAKIFFADSEQGWRASADVEKGLLPAASMSFLPLETFGGGTVTGDDLREMAKGLPDGRYVVKSTPANWWKEVAVNEISVVPQGHHPAALLIDWEEGRPVWRTIARKLTVIRDRWRDEVPP
jgi:hypothetical protein